MKGEKALSKGFSKRSNQLVIVGNGFDLAHGFKTSYRDFLNWYGCEAFLHFCDKRYYEDGLISIRNKYSGYTSQFKDKPKSYQDAINLVESNKNQSIEYKSIFFKKLVDSFERDNWVDIERYYFRLLKSFFSNSSLDKNKTVAELNKDFDILILKLSEYIKTVNDVIANNAKLNIEDPKYNLSKLFAYDDNLQIKFLNFNYTETLTQKGYATEEQVIHIHGRVADIDNNPIIFGYGDESDPSYQIIEDSGNNLFLDHIKSFGYFRTSKYHEVLSYIDSAPFDVSIVGHSCGLSDRVLLNEIFEHQNCNKIEIFYHIKADGSDNFKEITQEISRHFKPINKNMMRRRVCNKNFKNIIPQNF